jgi:hypothetical protein
MDINIEIEGKVVFYDITDDGESTAVERILINQYGATVWWKNNGAVWSYSGTNMAECLAVLRETDSMGKMAWQIKRTAKRSMDISDIKETNNVNNA